MKVALLLCNPETLRRILRCGGEGARIELVAQPQRNSAQRQHHEHFNAEKTDHRLRIVPAVMSLKHQEQRAEHGGAKAQRCLLQSTQNGASGSASQLLMSRIPIR